MISHETITQVHAADVAAARKLIGGAISAAGENWIPVNAIADALVQELVEYAARGSEPARMAAYLRGLATVFDRSTVSSNVN